MTAEPRGVEIIRCSFCGKSQDEVKTLLGGPSAFVAEFFICDGCVRLCQEILDEADPAPQLIEGGGVGAGH